MKRTRADIEDLFGDELKALKGYAWTRGGMHAAFPLDSLADPSGRRSSLLKVHQTGLGRRRYYPSRGHLLQEWAQVYAHVRGRGARRRTLLLRTVAPRRGLRARLYVLDCAVRIAFNCTCSYLMLSYTYPSSCSISFKPIQSCMYISLVCLH